MNYNKKEAGVRLRTRRKELGVTGEELAKKIGKAGSYYRDIERGGCGMSLETLIQLTSYLGVSMDYVIYGMQGQEKEQLSYDEMILRMLGRCGEGNRRIAVDILKAYLQGVE